MLLVTAGNVTLLLFLFLHLSFVMFSGALTVKSSVTRSFYPLSLSLFCFFVSLLIETVTLVTL